MAALIVTGSLIAFNIQAADPFMSPSSDSNPINPMADAPGQRSIDRINAEGESEREASCFENVMGEILYNLADRNVPTANEHIEPLKHLD